MSILLTGAGGLFTRSGHLGGILGVGTNLTNKDINDYSGTVVPNKVTQVLNDYAATPDDRGLVGFLLQITNGNTGGALGSWQTAQNSFLQQIQQLMQQTLTYMANADTPLPSPTSISAAMALLISQMTGVASVNASVPSAGAQTAVGSPNGNPTVVTSIKDNNGLALQYLFPETLNIRCTGDSEAGTGTLGQEPMQVVGAAPVGNTLSFNWPGGSGTNQRLNCISATTNFPNQGGNALFNSDFETFTTPNVPDNWPIGVGTAGTTVFSSSTAYQGVKSLEFLGTGGAVLCNVSQQFGQTTGGTSFVLRPNTQYAFKYALQVPVAPAAGVIQVDLADTAVGGSIIADNQSVANSQATTLSGLSGATWTLKSGVFRTPSVLPANQFIRIHLTTAIDSGKAVLIDSFALAPMTQLYTGGPWQAIFSNSNTLITNDQWSVAIGNTWGLFQKLFEKCYSMRQLGMVIPFSGSPSINDNLIA